MLYIVASYHCMQSQGKLMNQTWENSKKPSSGRDFGLFAPNLGCQIFFLKNLALSVTKYHGQLSSCTISEKTIDPILRIEWLEGREWFQKTIVRKGVSDHPCPFSTPPSHLLDITPFFRNMQPFSPTLDTHGKILDFMMIHWNQGDWKQLIWSHGSLLPIETVATECSCPQGEVGTKSIT